MLALQKATAQPPKLASEQIQPALELPTSVSDERSDEVSDDDEKAQATGGSATTTSTTPIQLPAPPPPLGALLPPTLSLQVQGVRQANQDGARRLHAAMVGGQLAEVKAVLAELPSLLNTPLKGQATALHLAAGAGNMEIMKFLLVQHGIALNPRDVDGCTPLLLAISNGRADLADLLVAAGADINTSKEDGYSAFHIACANGDIPTLEWMMEQQSTIDPSGHALSAMLNGAANDGTTPLHMAVDAGQLKGVERLLKRPSLQPNLADKAGRTALHTALNAGYTEVAFALLQHRNIEVDPKLSDGTTPLFLAIQMSNLQVARWLLKKGADINERTNDGNTLLHIAGKKGTKKVMNWVLDPHHKLATSVLNQPNDGGDTPLLVAVKAKNEEAVRMLLDQADIDPNAVNKEGMTPLHQAASQGHIACADMLLKHPDIQVNAAEPPYNLTPIYAAVEGKHLDMAKLLRDHGANIDAASNGDYTPLHVACNNGDLALVQWLMDPHTAKGRYAPALLNPVDDDGQTPLHLAVLQGRDKVIAHMVQHPAISINTKTHDGWAPLHDAVKSGNVRVIKALLRSTKTDAVLLGPHGANILHLASLAPDPLPLLRAIRSAIQPASLYEKLLDMPDEWGARPVSLAAQRSKGKDVIDALRPPATAQTRQPPLPTSFKRGWLIAGQDQPSWEDRNLAAMGTKAGIKMETCGNGKQDLTWEQLKKLDIQEGDFIICNFHARWDEQLQRVMLDLGNGESVPLVDLARLFYEKGALKVLFLGCEVSMAMGPLMERFNNDPTIPRPADRDGGYQGLDITAVGRQRETLISLNQDAAQFALKDCINVLEKGTVGTALFTQSVQPLSTVRWSSAQRQLEKVQRDELTVDTFDKNFTPEQFKALKDSLMLMHVNDDELKEVEALLAADKEAVHAQTDTGVSVLHVACSNGHKAMAEKLMQHRADIHHIDRNGSFPLYSACTFGHTEVVEMLLTAGAKVHQATLAPLLAFTPLHVACEEGFPDIVSLLLANGASNTAEDSTGRTPMDLARAAGHDDVVGLLEAHEQNQRPI